MKANSCGAILSRSSRIVISPLAGSFYYSIRHKHFDINMLLYTMSRQSPMATSP